MKSFAWTCALLLFYGHLHAQTPEPPKPKVSIQVSADYLSLQVKGTVTPITAALEYRLTLANDGPA
jgi:hypothetical protein